MTNLIFFCTILLATSAALAGGTVENGGSVLVCKGEHAPITFPPAYGNKFISADYAFLLTEGASAFDFVQVRDWGDSEQRISPSSGLPKLLP